MTTSTLSRRVAVVGIALLAIVVTGCGGTATTSASPAASAEPPSSVAPSVKPSPSTTIAPSASAGASIATSGRIAIPDHGFAVTLPDGWTRIDLQSDDIEALIQAAGAQNPELANVYSQQIRALVAQGLVLFAFGPDATTGTNLNILSAPSMGLTLDFLEQANLAQLKSLAEGNVTSERVTLPAGEALRLRYTIAAASGMPSPTIEQYVLVNGDKQLVISVTNASATDASAIARSIELLS